MNMENRSPSMRTVSFPTEQNPKAFSQEAGGGGGRVLLLPRALLGWCLGGCLLGVGGQALLLAHPATCPLQPLPVLVCRGRPHPAQRRRRCAGGGLDGAGFCGSVGLAGRLKASLGPWAAEEDSGGR